MGKKYKYSKKELAQKICEIDSGNTPVTEQAEALSALLEDAGDIPVISPITLRPFAKELSEIIENTYKDMFRPDDGSLYGTIIYYSDGSRSTEVQFSSFQEAFDLLSETFDKQNVLCREIYRNPSEVYPNLIIIEYNPEGVPVSVWGGNSGYRLEELRKIYKVFDLK